MKKIQAQVLEWIEQDKENIIDFFSKLVQCETPSDPGDTRSAMSLIKNFMDTAGLSYQEVKENDIMPNLISTVSMQNHGRHLMFNGHLDVMPAGNEPGWKDDPWSGKIEAGKIWGRGTSDMKAGVTAMLFAYEYLSRMKNLLGGRASLTLVSDEETGCERGTGYLFEQMESEMLADCVLTGEPSGTNAISFASKGYIQFTVRVKTRGAIAGYSSESKSAISIAAKIICDMKELEIIEVAIPEVLSALLADPKLRSQYEAVRGKEEAKLLSKITADVTMIRGGDLASVIASDCSFTVTVVTPIGTNPYQIVTVAQHIISRYPEAELLLAGISTADISDPAHEMVTILQNTVTKLGWEKPIPVADIAISDCRYWRYRGIPAFWYGPDGSHCSAANEYVEIEELLHLVRTYTLAAIQYLQKPALKTGKTNGISATQKSPFTPSQPEIRYIPPMYAAYMIGTAKSFKQADLEPVVNQLLHTLYLQLTKTGVAIGATAFSITEEKKIAGKRQVEVIVAFPVERDAKSTDYFEMREFPGTLAAISVHYGAGNTASSWNQLFRFASSKGYKKTGIYRECYIVSAPNPAELWTTELQLPIQE